MPENYFVANEEVVELHSQISRFAIVVARDVAQEHREANGDLASNDALSYIAISSIELHEAIMTLCSNGRASVTPIILRTMLDLLANILVIVNAKGDEIELMAFRYMRGFLKAVDFTKDSKKEIDGVIRKLPEAIQGRAKDFIFQGKKRSYWYKPEYKDAKSIIDGFAVPSNDYAYLYDNFSAASHGGILGLNLYKDSPEEEIHPNPRADNMSQNRALLACSRFMLDIFGTYAQFMGSSADADKIYVSLEESFSLLKVLYAEAP